MMLLRLFIEFFKIGAFAFGGGTAMLPLIYQTVEPFGVMDSQDFSDMVALSQITPGPVAANAATFVGMKFAGIPGAITATVAICIPCFVITVIVVKLLNKFRDNPFVEGAFVGIRPVTVGLVLTAVIFIANGVLFKGPANSMQMFDMDYYNLIPLGIFGVSIVLMSVLKIKPIWVMLIMAVVGGIIWTVYN